MTNEEKHKLLDAVIEATGDNIMGGKYRKAYESGVINAYNRLVKAIQALESSISIPSGATNGDVIKTVFGAKITTDESYGFFTDLDGETYFSRDWWFAPYKGDKTDDE